MRFESSVMVWGMESIFCFKYAAKAIDSAILAQTHNYLHACLCEHLNDMKEDALPQRVTI